MKYCLHCHNSLSDYTGLCGQCGCTQFQHPKNKPLFISYSHEDEKYLQQLLAFFTPHMRDELYDVWVDTEIEEGDIGREKLKDALETSKYAVLLISPHFLASNFISNFELLKLLKQKEMGGTIIIPVIVEPYDIDACVKLQEFKAINSPDYALSKISKSEQDRVWITVVFIIDNNLNADCMKQLAVTEKMTKCESSWQEYLSVCVTTGLIKISKTIIGFLLNIVFSDFSNIVKIIGEKWIELLKFFIKIIIELTLWQKVEKRLMKFFYRLFIH